MAGLEDRRRCRALRSSAPIDSGHPVPANYASMTIYESVKSELRTAPKIWAVTGAAGFIGSHLVEALLKLDQTVVGLDNFATGIQRNLDEVQASVTMDQWARFRFSRGDIRDLNNCRTVTSNADYVLHQAALGSVPRSLEDPIASNAANVTGFLNMLVAARDAKSTRFVFAASSSTYGDHPALPKVEENIGRPLSPYAVTKLVNELYAEVFGRCYGLETIGLRYFNVFGPRQDPNGPYAAVIPRWVFAMINNRPLHIYGDGETSRDFCYVANAVQGNILAATARISDPRGQILNIAVGHRTTLNALFRILRDRLVPTFPHLKEFSPVYRDFRPGDVKHSQASIEKAKNAIGYQPTHAVARGLEESLEWYVRNLVATEEQPE